MTDLTFTAHLHIPSNFVSHFPYINLEVFPAPWTGCVTLVHCCPSAGLTEIHSFLVSPPLVSLPLDFVSVAKPGLFGAPEPGALAPLYPAYGFLLSHFFFFTLFFSLDSPALIALSLGAIFFSKSRTKTRVALKGCSINAGVFKMSPWRRLGG